MHLQQFQSPPSKRNNCPSLFQCLELVLPWLTPQELAITSLTCRTLHTLSNSITLRRASDASKSLETHPIPFQNSHDEHPYAYFIYTPSQTVSSSQLSVRQSWGSSSSLYESSSETKIGVETLRFVDESGETASGCDCETCDDGCPCAGFDGVVLECGPSCGCGLNCGNRLTQSGIEVKLKILRDTRKGWGLYADQFIPKGRFVCEYAGSNHNPPFYYRTKIIYMEFCVFSSFSIALMVIVV